jgi:hypothetical protein
MLTAAIVGQGVIARKKEILLLVSIFHFYYWLWPFRSGRGPTVGAGVAADSMFEKGRQDSL